MARFFFIFLTLILISACTATETVSPPTPTASPPATKTATAVIPSTPIPEELASASQTPTSLPAPTATSTSLPTATPTISLPTPLILPLPTIKAENIAFVGHIGGMIGGIAVQDSYVYAANWQELTVLDFQDRENPKRIGYLTLLEPMVDVAVNGRFAYVAHAVPGEVWRYAPATDKITVVDITNPLNPQSLIQITGLGRVSLIPGIDTIYLKTENEEWWQLMGPEQPLPLSQPPDLPVVTIPDTLITTINDLPGNREQYLSAEEPVIAGNTLYTIGKDHNGSGWQVQAYDISALENPRPLGHYQTVFGSRLAYQNGNLFMGYAGDTSDGLYMINVSDPSFPRLVGQLPTSSNGFVADGQYLYVGNPPGAVVLDISNPPDFPQVAAISFENNPQSSSYLILDERRPRLYAISGGHVGFGSSLEIIDVSDPTNPIHLGAYSPGTNKDSLIYDVVVQADYAYVAQRNGLTVVSLADPSNPQALGFWAQEGSERNLDVVTGATGRTLVYLTEAGKGLQIIDVTDPINPQEINQVLPSQCETDWSHPISGYDVTISGAHAYWLSKSCGLIVFDIADPVNPTQVGYYDIAGRQILVVDKTIYISDGIILQFSN